MGAANVLKVFHNWHHLDDKEFLLLVYMALRARDNDAAPWYGAGHEELATIALGLPLRTERESELSLRKVRRAITILRRTGAITTHRHGRPGLQAVYLLWLDHPSPVTQRPVNNLPNVGHSMTGEGVSNTGHPVTGETRFIGHSAAKHRSLSDLPRRKEEEELQERRSSKPNSDNGELWKTPRLAVVEDPWAEPEHQPHRNGQASP